MTTSQPFPPYPDSLYATLTRNLQTIVSVLDLFDPQTGQFIGNRVPLDPALEGLEVKPPNPLDTILNFDTYNHTCNCPNCITNLKGLPPGVAFPNVASTSTLPTLRIEDGEGVRAEDVNRVLALPPVAAFYPPGATEPLEYPIFRSSEWEDILSAINENASQKQLLWELYAPPALGHIKSIEDLYHVWEHGKVLPTGLRTPPIRLLDTKFKTDWRPTGIRDTKARSTFFVFQAVPTWIDQKMQEQNVTLAQAFALFENYIEEKLADLTKENKLPTVGQKVVAFRHTQSLAMGRKRKKSEVIPETELP